MRLLVVSSEFPPGPGGIGTHAHRLSLALARRGWEPVILTSQDYASEEEIGRFNASQPFPVVRFRRLPGPPIEALFRSVGLSRWIRRHRPAVLLASGSRSVILTAGRASARALPWIAVGHGTEFGGRRGWEARALRWAFRRATGVVCVSEFTRARMREAGIRPGREWVIPNGADHERFLRLPADEGRAERRTLGLDGARILLSVGNVTERKGHDIVVRALPEILRRQPGTHYLVAGLPTRGRELEDLAESLGVKAHVRLLGRVEADRLVRLLNAADVFVMTSRRTADGDVEGYGIAAVEAALCGLPSVVSGGSGLAEAVRDRETGLVVPAEDAGATARAVLSLLENEAERREMGERARRRARAEQTWERCAERYDEALRSVAGGAGSVDAPPAVARRAAL